MLVFTVPINMAKKAVVSQVGVNYQLRIGLLIGVWYNKILMKNTLE